MALKLRGTLWRWLLIFLHNATPSTLCDKVRNESSQSSKRHRCDHHHDNSRFDRQCEQIDSISRYLAILSSSEMVGQNVSILMPQPFRGSTIATSKGFLPQESRTSSAKEREVLCRRKDGTTFPADLAVSQVDHLGLFTGILRDISSRKVMQRHILEIASDEPRRIGLELHTTVRSKS